MEPSEQPCRPWLRPIFRQFPYRYVHGRLIEMSHGDWSLPDWYCLVWHSGLVSYTSPIARTFPLGPSRDLPAFCSMRVHS